MNVYKSLLHVKNHEGFEIFSHLQATKLVCHSFVDANQRQIWVGDKEQFITHRNSSSQRTIIFLL